MIIFPEDILNQYAGIKPAYQKVYLILKDTLMQNAINYADKITEESVAEALKISRTPVRTAFTQLREEGLLKAGSKSPPPPVLSEKELLEILNILVLLESKAAYLAASRRPSDEDCSVLTQLVEDLHLLSEKREKQGLPAEGLRDLSMQFHLMIAKLSCNMLLYKTIVGLRSKIRPISQNSGIYTHYSGFTLTCMEQITNSVSNSRPLQAEVWMKCFLENSVDLYCYGKQVD